jgi:hypothetical protein
LADWGAFLLIFAVDASMPVYHRFGFIERGRWRSSETVDHPVALLYVSRDSMFRIRNTLRPRGHDYHWGPVASDPFNDTECKVVNLGNGILDLRLEPRAKADP